MGSTISIRSSRFITYRDSDDALNRKTSVVVRVLDSFTGQPPAIPTRIKLIQPDRHSPVMNASGYYLFFDLEDGDYRMLVEPDPVSNDYFLLQPRTGEPWSYTFERTITLPKADALSPIEDVVLVPKPSYPFPAGSTLLRGRVKRAQQGAALAVVKAEYKRTSKDDVENTENIATETATNMDGYYALFFKALPGEKQTVALKVTSGEQTASKSVEIKDGFTSSVNFDLQ